MGNQGSKIKDKYLLLINSDKYIFWSMLDCFVLKHIQLLSYLKFYLVGSFLFRGLIGGKMEQTEPDKIVE